MRSTNKRSRSKTNRPKSLGNIVNRVFDSSGPEGKVRGTPQQIIEKYQVLARDAQLSNDRVAAENFQQHAEHYTRMLAQAQREMQAEQEARKQQQDDRNRQHDDRNRAQGDDRNRNGHSDDRGQQPARRHDNRRQNDDNGQQHQASGFASGNGTQGAFAVQDFNQDADEATLVETPESKSSHSVSEVPVSNEADTAPKTEAKPANRRKPRVAKTAQEPVADAPAPQAAEGEEKPKPRRAPRKPRKPEAEADSEGKDKTSSAAE